MHVSAISHTAADVYALNEETAIVRIKTGKDVTAVRLIHDDPFAGGSMGSRPWGGHAQPMEKAWELCDHFIWQLAVKPAYKRLQYYFEIEAGDAQRVMLEDGFYAPERAFIPGRIPQYYRFPWMNASDVTCVPQWPADTVWYQIFPDRFCRGDKAKKRMKLRRWGDNSNIRWSDFYGGDLRGIIERLPYLHDLGITGIYLTPVLYSDSNHKYNTFDYGKIDPDFGTEEDMRELVQKAHALGMRVMVDAVFNHCGTQFAPWQDVVKNGKKSRYADWFFVNDDHALSSGRGTEDGRYFSFAFVAYMPKLNTNHPEVQDFLIGCCMRWVKEWDVDGVRFDVGNEVAHSFLKALRRQIKAVKPDAFLMGEIWHDASPWLRGDEYDSVMHYPLVQSLQNFWVDPDADAQGFMYAVNRCLSMYPENVTGTLFTLLDSHDVPRARTRCGSEDTFYQQLALLLTLPGSPCLYYGTEIAMEGGDDPDNRRTMPWNEIDAGMHDAAIEEARRLIALRQGYAQLRAPGVRFIIDAARPRLVAFERFADAKDRLMVIMNADGEAAPLPQGRVIYARKTENGLLMPGGAAVLAI